jgi:hypothetical protein
MKPIARQPGLIARLFGEETRAKLNFARRLGIRTRRSSTKRARAADPKRNRSRQRGRIRLHREPTPEDLRVRANWKRSKVGRAHARRARRPIHVRKSGPQIKKEHAYRKTLQRSRRLGDRLAVSLAGLARAGVDAAAGVEAFSAAVSAHLPHMSDLCQAHDLGEEFAPCTCEPL